MVPKCGDLQQIKNRRPIAIVKTTNKIFAKVLCDRLRPLLETEQSMDQVGFRQSVVLTTRWLCLKLFAVRAFIEWNSEIWFASLDLTGYSKH